MRGVLGAALSGALLLAAAPPLALTPLVLVALVPLLDALRAAPNAATAAGLGWIAGALFHAGLLAWLPATIARSQHLAWPAAMALFALFVAVHALQFALAAALTRLGRSPVARGAAAVGGWVLLEWAFPKVFPWSLGAALGPHPLLRQGADLFGVHGLAAEVVAVNALLAEALAAWPARRFRAGGALAGAGLLLGAAATYGIARPSPGTASVVATRIAVVQGGETDAGDADRRWADARAWARYQRLSAPLAGRADLVVWPESVLRVYLRDAPFWRGRVETLARDLRAVVVLGALDRGGDGGERVAAYVFAPALAGVAHKVGLVPFGEYVPGAAWLPVERVWRPIAARRAGPPPPVIDVAGVRLAPRICVEAIRPGAFNAAVRRGAGLLVNLSDDGWFASAWAAAQHLEMTRLRAVETRRWLVRSSQSGVSAVVDPRGAIVAALPHGQRGSLLHAVVPSREVTPYARWGDAPVLAASAALLVAAAWSALRAEA